MNDTRFIQQFNAAGRPGTYLRIIEEGNIGAGDRMEIVAVPDHRLTIGEIAHIYNHDRQTAGRLLAIDGLSDAWKGWAQKTLDRHRATNPAGPDTT